LDTGEEEDVVGAVADVDVIVVEDCSPSVKT
jgi:hypothetical protein